MRRHAWWVMGLVLIGGGVALALAARRGPDDFGWFAYSPSGADPASPDVVHGLTVEIDG